MAPEREEGGVRGAMLLRTVPCSGPLAAGLIPRYGDTKHLLNQRHMDILCIGSLVPSFPIPIPIQRAGKAGIKENSDRKCPGHGMYWLQKQSVAVLLRAHSHGEPECDKTSLVDESEESENR